MQFDYNYLCQGLAHLTGLETRVYLHGELAEHSSQYPFAPDLVTLVRQQIFARQDSVFYLETEDLLVFGVVRSRGADGATVVIGPTAQLAPEKNAAIAVLHQLGEAHGRLPELTEYFANMIPYPLENFLGILCFLNYAVNGEKRTAADLILGSHSLRQAREQLPPVAPPSEAPAEAADLPHNTWQMEQQMLAYVAAGNLAGIEAFIHAPVAGRIGSMAQTELRQRKNTFIVSATLICRAAIEGGLPHQKAFALSDRYIQKAELLNTGSALALLSVDMLTDYTRRVAEGKYGVGSTPFAGKVLRHIMQNLGEKLNTADMAAALGVSRQHLCEQFRRDTGLTVGECVTSAKIDEAKRLLRHTDLTISQISEYLAFSTQSYFQTVFKKTQGCTPKEYRLKAETAG